MLTLFGYILIAVLVTVVEVLRKKDTIIDALTMFHLYFLISYAISPIYLISFGSKLLSNYIIYDIGHMSTPYYILFSYLSFLLGWHLLKTKRVLIRPRRLKDPKILLYLCLLGSGIFILALILFISAFGGLQEALIMGALSRYGCVSIELGPTAFAKNILPVGSLVFFICYYKLFLERIRRKRRNWIILLIIITIPLVISFIVISSRGYMIGILMSIIIMHIIYYRRIPKRFLAVALMLGIIIVLFGKQMFFAIPAFVTDGVYGFQSAFYDLQSRRMGDAPIGEALFRDSVHAIVSLECALSSAGSELPYTYFNDFIWALVRIVPQKITLMFITHPPAISTINTGLLTSIDVASIPPGLLGHFAYAGGFLGMLIGMSFYGASGALLQKTLLAWFRKSKIVIVYYVPFCIIYGSFVSNGDPNVYIYDAMWPPLSLLIIWPFLVNYPRSEDVAA